MISPSDGLLPSSTQLEKHWWLSLEHASTYWYLIADFDEFESRVKEVH